MRWLLILIAAWGAYGCDGGPAGVAPEATLEAPLQVELGGVGRLDGSRSIDADEDIVAYRFTIADGSESQTVTTPTIEHTFHLAGRIEVQLEVIDSRGHVGTARAIVAVRR